mmetsp:Transcript_30783/g.61971  ORF Transcript_30783/g.61971 Transcript_30783/m.61971 type:complete len:85 (-) Transcript_30783:330-584(-)
MRKWMTPLRRKRANREGQKGRDPPPRNLRLPQPPLLHRRLLAVVVAAAGLSDCSDGRMNREYASDSDSGPGRAVPFQLGSSGLL